MDRRSLHEKLHISSIDEQCREHAQKYVLGLEIAEFCWAKYLDEDQDAHIKHCRELMDGFSSFWFHAPFAELAACAIDPRARELARLRYDQSVEAAKKLGIKRLVIHGGYIPYVYYPETYVEWSSEFWRDFVSNIPHDFEIALENVMEPDPSMLIEIARNVSDKRFGLCLDVGHANTEISAMPPIKWIEPMSPYLKHVHIHNNFGERDLHNCLGEGSIQMESVLDRIMSLCPNATFTIENMYSQASLDWLIDKGYIENERNRV